MTVGELIEKLLEMPQDAEIITWVEPHAYSAEPNFVEQGPQYYNDCLGGTGLMQKLRINAGQVVIRP